MKSTKIMLAVIATLTLTAMFFGLIGYMLSDLTYKQCMQHGALWFAMLIVGWVPAVIVGIDLEEHA
jgi:hypothetical protein